MEQVAPQHNTIRDNINANQLHDPINNNTIGASPPMVVERKVRPQKDQNLNCPRCNSTNTKFCYYNNYSLTQPRYFCKSCRRYWTQGGSLRNVPVGGGSRRNRRSSTSSSTTLATPSSSSPMDISTIPNNIIPDLNPPRSFPHLITPSQNPKFLEGQDLNLGFPIQGFFQPLDQHQLPKIEASNNNSSSSNVTDNENHKPIYMMNGNTPNASTTTSCTATSQPSCGGNSGENNNDNVNSISALELLRNGIASKGSLSSYVPMPISDSNTLYPPSGFPNLQEVKPSTIGVFPSQGDHHHHGNGYEHMIGSGANARLLFPFANMNKLANSTPNHHHNHEIDDQHKGRNGHHHHHHHQAPTSGYWTTMLGGGTW